MNIGLFSHFINNAAPVYSKIIANKSAKVQLQIITLVNYIVKILAN